MDYEFILIGISSLFVGFVLGSSYTEGKILEFIAENNCDDDRCLFELLKKI